MKKDSTEIVVLLDRTGSMGSIKEEAIGAFNSFVSKQKALPGEATMTLVQFDSEDPHEVVIDRKPIAEISLLSGDVYQPRSMTPLYDAMGWTIDQTGKKLESVPERDRPETVVFVVLTDGLENASREHSKDSVFKKVTHQQDKYGWKFVYLGANQNAMAEGRSIGIRHDPLAQNIVTFAADALGIVHANCSSVASVAYYRTGVYHVPEEPKA